MKVEFDHLGSLITLKGTDNCLGYLMDFKDRGVYEPSLGRVRISPEHAKAHNEALDKVLLEGLDERCEVGQYGSFYHKDRSLKTPAGNPYQGHEVRTFTGTLVSAAVSVVGRVITFSRKGKEYRGRLKNDADVFTFKRVK